MVLELDVPDPVRGPLTPTAFAAYLDQESPSSVSVTGLPSCAATLGLFAAGELVCRGEEGVPCCSPPQLETSRATNRIAKGYRRAQAN